MNLGEKLALFLGMLSGDGCLSKKHNGEGYRDYPIDFCNTDKSKVLIFSTLFNQLFDKTGRVSSRKRAENRLEIWSFLKHSVEVVKYLRQLGFPEGVKRDVLRILPVIWHGTNKEKIAFIYGVLITDGSLNESRILFHSGSKLFLKDLSKLISCFINAEKPVKEYVQREVYKSYQDTVILEVYPS